MSELKRYYLNNDPWLSDNDLQVFQDERDSSRTLQFDDLAKQGLHMASLNIVVIKGLPILHG